MTTCYRCTREATHTAYGTTVRGDRLAALVCDTHADHAQRWLATWQTSPTGGLFQLDAVAPIDPTDDAYWTDYRNGEGE